MIDSGFINKIAMFGLPVLAYMFGSIPWGLLITRIYRREDIRRKGSGNIGATNVRRVAGSTLGLLTLAGAAFLLVFILMVAWSRRVSLGSLCAAGVLPIAIWIATHSPSMSAGAAIATIFIFVRHKDNIQRLLSGTEPDFRGKKNLP